MYGISLHISVLVHTVHCANRVLLISVQAGFEGTHNKNRASMNTGIAPIEYSRAALPWTYLIYFLIRKLSYIYVAPVANLAV